MRNDIIKLIKSTIIEYESDNQLENMWNEPLIEIISVENNGTKDLKQIISLEHFLPTDILSDARSIISFFVPFHENIVNSNISGTFASREWALAYIKTNTLLEKISNDIEIFMKEKGYKTGKIPPTHNFDKSKLISNWSHRHIAYIAGLGTFGINNMLITKYGCCGRFGSIVLNYEFDEYSKINKLKEKCLNKLNGTCGKCLNKCKVKAYENKFNRHKCYEQCLKNAEIYKNIGYAAVCGKCLVGLPCSIKIP